MLPLLRTFSDGLNKLPVFFGSNSGRVSTTAVANKAGNILNLLNFGENRTLVLFDGHRVAPSNFDFTIDTDVLPQMLVSRVDVVTGGASATYGSDAVTGVVNYVLDKNFSGIKYDASGGISKYGDAAQYQFGLAMGADLFGGRGHIEGSLRLFHQDKVQETSRPDAASLQAWALTGAGTAANPYVSTEYARIANEAQEGGIVTCACAANNSTFVSNGVLGPYDPGTTTGTSNLNVGGDGGGYFKTASFDASLRTAESFLRFSYDVNKLTVAFVEFTGSESGNLADFSAATLNPGTGRGNQFYTNNAYLPAAAQAQLSAGNKTGTFTFSEFLDTVGGVPASSLGLDFQTGALDRNLGMTAGVDGKLFDAYNWSVFYTHGESREEGYVPHNANLQKLQAAEDAVLNSAGQVVCNVSLTSYANLYPGCVPINPFGPNSVTALQVNYFTQRTGYVATNIMDDLGGSLSGQLLNLPAGPVTAGLSVESRWQSLTVESAFNPAATPDCTGLRLCTPNSASLFDQGIVGALPTKSLNVTEAAAEINVPVVKDLPLVQSLALDVAGRFTHYSTSGDVETWKIGFDHHVDDSLRFRGTMSVDIRAPNLYDLYKPLTIATSGLNDILTNQNLPVQTRTQGNPNLSPEVAHTYTGGAVLTPDFIPNLTVSLDYFKINMSNAITGISYSATDIQNLCIKSGGTSNYCSLAPRPYPFTNTTAANFPLYVLSESLNSARTYTEGVDFEANYNFAMADLIDGWDGSFNLRSLVTYQPYEKNFNYPGAVANLTVMPKTRATFFFTYNIGRWAFNLQDTWDSHFSRKTLDSQVYVQPYVTSFNQLDMSVDKQYDIDGRPVDFFVSVQNVINAQPPLYVTAGLNAGLTYPVLPQENAMGRYFTIGIRGNM